MKRLTLTFYVIIALVRYNSSTAQEIDLWENEIPFSIDNPNFIEETTTRENGIVIVSKVKKPTLRLYLNTNTTNPAPAMIICPGGAYVINAIDHEGYKVAEWLNSVGIKAFVLKYRLPEDTIMTNKSMVPLTDAQQAIRIVRSRSVEWNIDPDKIGIMGFSAGGHLASTVSTHFEIDAGNIGDPTSLRPDFSVLVYPVISMEKYGHSYSKTRLIGDDPTPDQMEFFNNHKWVDENTPPTFLVHSSDDEGVPVENSIRYFRMLEENNVPAALHIFSTGGHGYGLRNEKGPESDWKTLLVDWMIQMGIKK